MCAYGCIFTFNSWTFCQLKSEPPVSKLLPRFWLSFWLIIKLTYLAYLLTPVPLLLAMVDLARRRLPQSFPFGKLALEARIVSENSQLSSCKFHPQANKVCPQCSHQVDTANVLSDCPHCIKQYLSIQPPKSCCPPPTNYDAHDSPPFPPFICYQGESPSANRWQQYPPFLLPCCSKRFRISRVKCSLSILDQLHELSRTQNSYADKLSQLEESSSWQETKHKSCQSIKRLTAMQQRLKGYIPS